MFYDYATGKPSQSVKKGFHATLRKVSIHDFRFHDLRHDFASHLVIAGVHLATGSKLLGHKSLTMRVRYSHLSPNYMAKAVNILDNVLNDNQNSTSQLLHNSQLSRMADVR